MRNPKAVAVTSMLMWRPRHGVWCRCISLVQFISEFPEKKPVFELTPISQQIHAAGILITTAFYSGRVIFKIVFIFPVIKSGKMKVAGGEVFCSDSTLCFNNSVKFIFSAERRFYVHHTRILFCCFPIFAVVKIKLIKSRGGHQDAQRVGALLLGRQAEEAGVVQPGEEKAVGRTYCVFSVPEGSLYKRRGQRF